MFSVILIIAQAPDVPPWLQATGFGALTSLVVWWVYYNTAVAIPKIHQEQREHVEMITTTHGEVVKTLVEEFRAENREHRTACAEEKRMLWDQLHGNRLNPRKKTEDQLPRA